MKDEQGRKLIKDIFAEVINYSFNVFLLSHFIIVVVVVHTSCPQLLIEKSVI